MNLWIWKRAECYETYCVIDPALIETLGLKDDVSEPGNHMLKYNEMKCLLNVYQPG